MCDINQFAVCKQKVKLFAGRPFRFQASLLFSVYELDVRIYGRGGSQI